MLIDIDFYKESLADLWHSVFGDDYSFISLIFNKEYKDSILCFAEIESEKAVSAFYLLKCILNYDGKEYNGYYLYAAATFPSHRKNGIMTKLIKEAQLYCKENKADFISLVPSEDSLYSYYGRHGFITSMYCESRKTKAGSNEKNISSMEYYTARKQTEGNFINFDKKAFMYAADCLENMSAAFYKNEDEYFIRMSDGELIEVLSSADKKYDKYPFGMLYPINPELKRDWEYTDIYMNIALD